MILLFLAVTACPCRVTASTNEHLATLVVLMIQRLQLSREVAWSKYQSGTQVADPSREARMLTDLKAAGQANGLSSLDVARLFLPQIAASRRYQEELIAGWRSGIDVPKVQPLVIASEIRPRLDKVNREMLLQWARIFHTHLDWADREEADRTLRESGIPAEVARMAVLPLEGPSQ